jgi:hypothetical protein
LNPDLTFDRVYPNFAMLHARYAPVLPLAASSVLLPIISCSSSKASLFLSPQFYNFFSTFFFILTRVGLNENGDDNGIVRGGSGTSSVPTKNGEKNQGRRSGRGADENG